MSDLAGTDWKVDLTGAGGTLPLKCNRYDVPDMTTANEAAHSESRYKRPVGGLWGAEITLEQATLDDQELIYGAPFSLIKGQYYELKIWADQRGGDVSFYCETAFFEGTTSRGELDGLQPQTLKFRTFEEFQNFGEAAP